MNDDNLTIIDKSNLQGLVDDLKYLEGSLIPLQKELIQRLENIAISIDKKIEEKFGEELSNNLEDMVMTNKLLYYTVVTDKEAFSDALEYAKKINDKKFLKWYQDKELRDLKKILLKG